MTKLLVDTNFLIDVFRFSIGTSELDEYEIFTIEGVVKELRTLAEKRGEEGGCARLALKWLAEHAKVLNSEANTDDAIVAASKAGCIVATNDRELRERLKSTGVKTIYVRARKHLELS